MMCHFHFLSSLPQIKPVAIIFQSLSSSLGGGGVRHGAFNYYSRTIAQTRFIIGQHSI